MRALKIFLLTLTLTLGLTGSTVCGQLTSDTTKTNSPAQTSQPASTPVFKSTTRAVTLDAVVTDKNGHVITGLAKEDFTLLEDGRPENIASFEASEAAANKDDHTVPRTILLIDEMNCGFANAAYVRYSTAKLLKLGKGQLDVPTALMVLGDQGLIVLKDFTRDAKELDTALQLHHPALPWRLMQGRAEGAERIDISIGSLRQIAFSSQGLGTRTNVVWISPGFPVLYRMALDTAMQKRLSDDIRNLSDQLLKARITV